MSLQHVLIVILGFIASSQTGQIPKAYVPGKSVTYPRNYCENIKNHEEFDFVVIGSGPGGSTVARRLAENPTSNVLLIEAGGDPPKNSDLPGKRGQFLAETSGTELRWNWTTVPNTFGCALNKNGACKYEFGRVLGGSSVINTMMALRGNPADFNEWQQLGSKGWSYKEVLPYFQKLETYHDPPEAKLTVLQKIQRFQDSLAGVETEDFNKEYHGTTGPLSISQFPIDPLSFQLRQALFKAFKALKLPINDDPNGKTQTGFSNIPGIVDTLGYRDSIVKAYLQDLPKNLKVCKNAMVWKLNVEDSTRKNKTVKSVLFQFNKKFMNVTAKKEFILSAGAIGTPQILERSGIGNPKILKKAGVTVKHVLPGVGENFQDHLLNTASPFTVTLNNEASQNPLSIGITSLSGFLNLTDYTNSIPDVQFLLQLEDLPKASPKPSESKKQPLIIKKQEKKLLFILAYVLRQQIRGSVHITQATDPNLTPSIIPNFYKGKRDLELTIAGVRLVRKIMRHPALQEYKPELTILDQCKKFKEDSDEEITCQINYSSQTSYHAVGTSAMGHNEKKAVVNDELKVHGIGNLRVIDCSVMPLITRSNTELTTVMIAEKGADLVKAGWYYDKKEC